jgi:hypothetical protein
MGNGDDVFSPTTHSRSPHSLFPTSHSDVISSSLINATSRNTRNQEASEPNSDADFPKTDTSAAIINHRPRG